MSFLNLVATFLTPTYETLYLVWTPALEEIQYYGGFDGTIGEIDVQKLEDRNLDPRPNSWNPQLWFCLLAILGLIPFAILGAITGFAVGQSTLANRAWITSWIGAGVIIPVFTMVGISGLFGRVRLHPGASSNFRYLLSSKRMIAFMIAFMIVFMVVGYGSFVAAIGGYVVVGKMLREFGVCALLR